MQPFLRRREQLGDKRVFEDEVGLKTEALAQGSMVVGLGK
jgi:hypothetical protein